MPALLNAVWVKVRGGSAISGDLYGHSHVPDGTRVTTGVVKSALDGKFLIEGRVYTATFVGEKGERYADDE